jgi:hypothetical protein
MAQIVFFSNVNVVIIFFSSNECFGYYDFLLGVKW